MSGGVEGCGLLSSRAFVFFSMDRPSIDCLVDTLVGL